MRQRLERGCQQTVHMHSQTCTVKTKKERKIEERATEMQHLNTNDLYDINSCVVKRTPGVRHEKMYRLSGQTTGRWMRAD